MEYDVNDIFASEVFIISYRLRELRENAELSQQKIADIIHMHRTTYVRYETGEREIPLNIAILLAQYYNVSLDYLTGISNLKH